MKMFLLIVMAVVLLALPAFSQNAEPDNKKIIYYDANNKAIGSKVNPEAGVPLDQINSPDANSNVSVEKNSVKKEVPFWQQVLNMILSLVIVLFVAYIIMNIMKKIYNGDIRIPGNVKISESSSKRGLIKVVETASLGQGRTLFLITVEKRAFLVASSGQQFTLIGEFVDEEWQKNTASATPANTPIEAALSRILGNKEKQN